MCGIAGYFGPKKFEPSNNQITKCINLMKKRGPDFQNYLKNDFNSITSLMLHSRLSIIDLSEFANQPMEDNKGIISFNGEIYNYLELIQKFKFHDLKTESDTEVLLNILNKSGGMPTEDLDGMWSYAYLNKIQKKLTISRDWFGEKPLYYLCKNNCLYYGSNIDYINILLGRKSQINEEKLINFISTGFKQIANNSETFDSEINSLEPSSILSIDESLKIKKKIIWNTKPKKISTSKDYFENISQLKKILKDTIGKRLRSDVPIACLLSGGIDSTSIVGHAKKYFNKNLKCYTIANQKEKYNEDKLIDTFSKFYGVKTKYILMDTFDNFKFLNEIIKINHCPLSSISYLAYAHLIKAAKDDGNKVILSGNGGDEMFAGYLIHYLCYLFLKKNDDDFREIYNPWEKHVKPLIRSKILSNFGLFSKLAKNNDHFFHEKSRLSGLLKIGNKKKNTTHYSKNFFRNQLMVDLFEHSVPAHNITGDQVSMHFSVENRNPFLSKEIFNFSNSIPDDRLIGNGYGKKILRDALKSLVPDKILNNREKIGFNSDINSFFNLEDKHFREQLYQSETVNKYLVKNKIDKILKKEKRNNTENKFIFDILNLSILTQ